MSDPPFVSATRNPASKVTSTLTPADLTQLRILQAVRGISASALVLALIREEFARLPTQIQALASPDAVYPFKSEPETQGAPIQ